MKRRDFLKDSLLAAGGITFCGTANLLGVSDPISGWFDKWREGILGDAARHRYCDTEMGEEIGWLISPFLLGFYYGYEFSHDPIWIEHFIDWTDSWIKRGGKDPGGFIGWPKMDPKAGFLRDSLLGEAMALRPVVLMAKEILRQPALRQKYGGRAAAWLDLAGKIFEKWDSFDSWREVKGGGVWVAPDFGIDPQLGNWTKGYARRAAEGLTDPDNKLNFIARWHLAMHEATGKAVYNERAAQWFRVMKSRMQTREGGKYLVWNYWEPAGPWDYKPDGSPRHWVGVHPNGGYYGVDADAIVDAYEHGVVFTREDIARLIATNRDYMWNHQIKGAKFQRIDGGLADPRWKQTPGILWTGLVSYDNTLRKIFVENFEPASWSGLATTPWFLAREKAGK